MVVYMIQRFVIMNVSLKNNQEEDVMSIANTIAQWPVHFRDKERSMPNRKIALRMQRLAPFVPFVGIAIIAIVTAILWKPISSSTLFLLIYGPFAIFCFIGVWDIFPAWYNSHALNSNTAFMQVDANGKVVRMGNGGWRIKSLRHIALTGKCFEDFASQSFACDVLYIHNDIKCLSKKTGKNLHISFSTQFAFGVGKRINMQVLWDEVISTSITDTQETFSMEEFFEKIIKDSFKEKDLAALVEAQNLAAIQNAVDATVSAHFPLGIMHKMTVNGYFVEL